MITTQQIADAAARHAAASDYMVWIQTAGAPAEYSPAHEAAAERTHHTALALEDALFTLRARYALQTVPGLAGLAVATLTPAPAGPDVLGSPMVWINTREYWADEVLALANH